MPADSSRFRFCIDPVALTITVQLLHKDTTGEELDDAAAVLASMHPDDQAEFRQMIKQYPSSDKIDDAAFFCGEIHKEYLPGQELIAVRWYERAFEWNSETPHPARFQAAMVYDYRLHDRDRALELYHATLESEADDASNVRFATRRIRELTGGVQAVPASAKKTSG